MPLSYPGVAFNRTITSASDPTVNDDSGDGYVAGQTFWLNTTTKVAFELVDATAGAAVWSQVGAESHPGFVSGRYYTMPTGAAASTFLLVENTIYYQPLYVPKSTAFDRLGFDISTGAGAAQNEVRTAIYKTTGGKPGALVVDNGRTVIGTGTGNINVTIAQTLVAGWYWLAVIANRAPSGSATQPTLRATASEARCPSLYWIGSAAPNISGTASNSYRFVETVADWTTYVFPATAPGSTLTEANQYPVIFLRAA